MLQVGDTGVKIMYRPIMGQTIPFFAAGLTTIVNRR
jgi:hypothetical protein